MAEWEMMETSAESVTAAGGWGLASGWVRLVVAVGVVCSSGVTAAWADGPPRRWEMPEARRTVVVTRTIVVPAGTSVDFHYTRFVAGGAIGDGSQREGQQPVMVLMKGASVRRVLIGRSGADGIHCRGGNRLEDVWFEDVGEDAVTVEGPGVTWRVGGARHAQDKIVQMNHAGPFVGEHLFFEDFATGVRGNGNPSFRRTPFRATLRDVGARQGRCLMRFSSWGARGDIRGVYLDSVTRLSQATGGAIILWSDKEQVVKRKKQKGEPERKAQKNRKSSKKRRDG